MRVALDLRWLQQAYVNSPDGGLGGIGAFSRNLWLGLAQSNQGIELTAVLRPGPIAPDLRTMIEGTPGAAVALLGGPNSWWGEARASLRLAGRLLETELIGLPSLSRHRIDILHSLDHTPPPRRAAFATVVTVYDLIGLDAPPTTATLSQRLFARYQQASAGKFERAAAVAPISETTAKKLKGRFPNLADRIEVIPPGIRTVPLDTKSSASTPRPEWLPRRYFLHVGLLTPRKNPAALIQGFHAWASTHGQDARLLCVGPYEANAPLRAEIAKVAKANGITHLVDILSAQKDSELAVLYSHAEALVFPSFDEGFGMPLVESLAYGTPCVASDLSWSREAAGSLGIYVDPHSTTSIALGLERACVAAHRSRLRRDGPVWSSRFSLRAMAERYAALYRRCLATRITP